MRNQPGSVNETEGLVLGLFAGDLPWLQIDQVSLTAAKASHWPVVSIGIVAKSFLGEEALCFFSSRASKENRHIGVPDPSNQHSIPDTVSMRLSLFQ